MNPRLLSYLRSIGLATEASDEMAEEYLHGLRGLRANIANCLNYNQQDNEARTNCDLMIRSLGYDPQNPKNLLVSEPEPQQRNHPGPTQTPGGDGASLQGDLEEARSEGIQQERVRVATIREYATVAGCSDDFLGGLVDDPSITADAARARIFEDHESRTRANVSADMPGAPAGHVRGGITQEVIEATMLHRRGIDPTEFWARNDNGTPTLRRSGPELEQAADQAWEHRAASLEDVVRMCATLDGITLPTGRSGLLQSYIEQRGMSTSALSAVFTTNVNSELIQAFQVAEDSTGGGWIREADVSDFRTNERARIKNGGALSIVPRGGEADHATYDDIVESYKIARYGSQFVIDDQDIQDDNFGGATGFVPADMGVAARQVRADLVYSIIMGNPNMRDAVALFHANHGNLSTSSALAGDGILEAVRKAMRIQQENGRNLNIMPAFLIVPPALEDTAEVMLTSELIVSGISTSKPNRNPNTGKGIQVVTDARLENGVTDPTDPTGATVHAGSATTWFMAATAASHTIEVGYLRGTGRAPQIRPFVLDKGRWGLGWDVKMDVGAKALDWLGLSKAMA